MSYKTYHQCRSSKRSTSLQIQNKIRNLRDCYKTLTQQNRVGADLIWGSIVPPFFVPAAKAGNLRVLETAVIGEKNPAHLYTNIVHKVVS